MAFVLDPGVPLADSAARVLAEQSAVAVTALDGPDLSTGVHDARKASKRARALLRLIGAPRAEIERFRDAAAAIGGARDGVVCHETFAEVFGDRHPEVLAALQEDSAPSADAVARARALFATDAATLDPTPLAAGLVAGYRRARRAFPREDAPAAELIHAWRTRVKVHQFQLRLVTPWWPGMLGALVEELDTLGETLGKHHDLVVLRSRLETRGQLTEEMAATLDARMAGRWGHARLLGERLFAVPRRPFRRWIRAVVG